MWDSRFVILTCMMLSTTVLQHIGFFTPYWACHLPKEKRNYTVIHDDDKVLNKMVTTTASADRVVVMQGLFYTCYDGTCEGKVLAEDILGLCVTSLFAATFVAPYLLKQVYEKLRKDGNIDLEFDGNMKITYLIFLGAQLLAGIAGFVIIFRYDAFSWSSVLFCSFGFLLLLLVIIVFSCYLQEKWCKNK